MARGSFTGTGSGTITVVISFQPDYVMVTSKTNGVMAFRLPWAGNQSMLFTTAAYMAISTACITAINVNGFDVSTGDGLNLLGAENQWIAWKAGG